MNLQKSGSLIAEKRKEKNLTQKQLGELIGVSDKAVSKWERGLSFPDIGIVEKVADVLGLTLAELLNGEMDTIVPEQTEVLLKDILRLSLLEFARRKKQTLVSITAALAILVSLIALWAFIVQPVDGTGKTDHVDAQAFPSDNVLSLPLKTRINPGDFYAFGDMYFKTDLTRNELEEKLIAWFGEENVTDYNHVLLVEQPDAKGRTDFYMLAFRGFSDGKKSYIWTGMRMTLSDGEDKEDYVLLPLHLFDDSRICLRDSVQLVCGTEYEVCEYLNNSDFLPSVQQTVDVQVFADFYTKSGWFDVITEKNLLTVLPKEDCPMKNGFTVAFASHAGNLFCSFAYID